MPAYTHNPNYFTTFAPLFKISLNKGGFIWPKNFFKTKYLPRYAIYQT